MDKKVSWLLNEQINTELYSAYLYLDMANFYSAKGLDGFANWYEIQAKEEQDHAMLMYRYLHNNSQTVTLEAVAKPDKEFKELSDPLKAAYEHEQYVTGLKEQGEEEKNAGDIITKMELFGGDAKGLYMLNSELGARVYSAPSLVL